MSARVISGGKFSEREPIADKDATGAYVLTVTNVPANVTPSLEIVVDGVVVGSRDRVVTTKK